MIRTHDIQIISDMFKYAKKNQQPKKYSMVAFLTDGKRVVSIGVNNYNKTHPSTPQIKEYILPKHAEIDCIARYLVKHKPIKSTLTLYVVGLTQGKAPNPVISSKPCDSCENFIRSVGIPRVVYFENVEKFTIKEWSIV